MKKNFFLLLLALALVSCHNELNTETVYDVPEYTEPDWSDVDNYQCHQDQWLHVPDSMLQSDLIARLVDAYNINVVWHSVGSDMECHWRWETMTDSSIDEMDITIIKDDKARRMAADLCQMAISSQYSEEVDFEDAYSKYLGFVTSEYNISEFIDSEAFTEDAYWNAVAKSNWVADWDSLYYKRGENDSKHMSFLLHAMDTASTFDARCVYALEYAHSSDQGPYFDTAIPYLVKFLTAGRYSPMLREMWQTWRAMQSAQMGMSKDSDIPNAEYNRLRMIACYTMLCYIQEHPSDCLAINNFLITSFIDNICRFGNFTFGNQSAIEHIECFPEHYRDILNKDEE